jgi:hypothetical protein
VWAVLKGIHTTLLIGQNVPEPASYDLIEALTSLEVRTEDPNPSTFQLRFGLTNRSPARRFFMLDNGETILHQRVIIVVTVNGTPTVLMDGVTTNHQYDLGSGGQTQLVVTGEDLTALMNRQIQPREFASQYVEEQVRTILGDYTKLGIRADVNKPTVSKASANTDQIPIKYGTDLNYIHDLANRWGHVFYLEPGPVPNQSTAYWGPPKRDAPVQPALTMDMGPYSNVEGLNFSYDMQRKRFSVPSASDLQRRGFKAVLTSASDRDGLRSPLGRVQPKPVSPDADERPWADNLSKFSPEEAKQRTAAHEARLGEVVQGQGSLNILRYGHILRARQTVLVRGVGEVFDGVHYVSSVTHKISRGEYKQEFSLSRNALMSSVERVSL